MVMNLWLLLRQRNHNNRSEENNKRIFLISYFHFILHSNSFSSKHLIKMILLIYPWKTAARNADKTEWFNPTDWKQYPTFSGITQKLLDTINSSLVHLFFTLNSWPSSLLKLFWPCVSKLWPFLRGLLMLLRYPDTEPFRAYP